MCHRLIAAILTIAGSGCYLTEHGYHKVEWLDPYRVRTNARLWVCEPVQGPVRDDPPLLRCVAAESVLENTDRTIIQVSQ